MTSVTRRIRLATLCGALAAMLGAVSAQPAAAQQAGQPSAESHQPAPLELPPLPQPKDPAGQTFGDWVRRCDPAAGNRPQRCFISQIVVMKHNEQKRHVLFVAIGYYGPNKTPGIILRVPLGLGIYLPTGLILKVPGIDPVRVVVEACLPGGCNGAAILAPEMITAMQKANRGSVELRTIRKQKLALPVSFKGFTAGFASLDKG